jgi:hypothetical protein
MRELAEDLIKVIDAVEVLSATSFRLAGETYDVSDSTTAGQVIGVWPGRPDPKAREEADPSPRLVSALEQAMYGRLYVRPTRAAPTRLDPRAGGDFVASLSAANCGRGTWESGWTVTHTDEDGRVGVVKDDLTFWVGPEGVRTPDGAVRPGDACWVRIGKEIRALMPGFYWAIGDGDPDDTEAAAGTLVRYYWHLKSDAAVHYMAEVTRRFNAARVPFRAKVLSAPDSYCRADAGVLYVEKRHHPAARHLVGGVLLAVRAGLREEVPLFTKRLAPGLGLAESAASGLSYGQGRCRLMAEALWAEFARGGRAFNALAGAVAQAFDRAGLDPRLPYLELGSDDTYDAFGGDESSCCAPLTPH